MIVGTQRRIACWFHDIGKIYPKLIIGVLGRKSEYVVLIDRRTVLYGVALERWRLAFWV